MSQLKTKSKELNRIWPDLCEIFDSYTGLSCRDLRKLEKLGFSVEKTGANHYKMTFRIGEKQHIVILSSTPSDFQAGRQILRQIRRVYENGWQ